MRIDWISIEHFGKFQDLKLSFPERFSVIYGENEAGKSTIFAFIKAMLYGFGDSRGDISQNNRKKYSPWDGSPMSGSMQITVENNSYIISRRSGKTKAGDKLSIINALTGESVSLNTEELLGVSEPSFVKTLYIPQLGSGSLSSDEEITSRLLNLASCADEDSSYENAMKILDSAKRELLHKKGIGGRIEKVKERIFNLKGERYEAQNIHKAMVSSVSSLKELEAKQGKLKKEIENFASYEEDAEKSAHFDAYQVQKERLKQLCEEISLSENILKEKENAFSALQNERITPRRSKRPLVVCALSLLVALGAFFSLWFLLPALLLLSLAILPDKKYNKAKEAADEHERLLSEKQAEKIVAEQSLRNLLERKAVLDKEISSTEELLQKKYGSLTKEPAHSLEKDKKQEEYLSLSRDIVNLQGEVKMAFSSVRNIAIIEAEIEEAEELLDALQKKYDALTLAEDTLFSIFQTMQRDFAPLLNQTAQDIFSSITGQKRDILISSDLVPSLGTQNLAYFSNGTVDQTYLALRLALIELILKDSLSPVFLDDPFVQYDRARLKSALCYLDKMEDRQIFLFTCHDYKELLPSASYINI